jgi:hypothetical protein
VQAGGASSLRVIDSLHVGKLLQYLGRKMFFTLARKERQELSGRRLLAIKGVSRFQ